jgi:hypothetical protein
MCGMTSKIKDIIAKLFVKDSMRIFTNAMGRWGIDYRHSVINRKIDLANIDNCGTCYVVPSTTKKETMK